MHLGGSLRVLARESYPFTGEDVNQGVRRAARSAGPARLVPDLSHRSTVNSLSTRSWVSATCPRFQERPTKSSPRKPAPTE